MNHLDRFLKSRGTVTSRDRDVVVIKFLKNISSKSFFKLGGGVCTNKNSSLRGLILDLSIESIKILELVLKDQPSHHTVITTPFQKF